MSRTLDEQLFCAADAGDVAGCCAAIAAGADVHAGGDRALRWAASRGHAALVTALLAAGANPNAHGGIALSYAAFWGHLDVVRLLIEASPSLGGYECAALGLAAVKGHVGIVRTLIKARARLPWPLPNTLDRYDPNALDLILQAPGCMTREDAHALREMIENSPHDRMESLRQRWRLQRETVGTGAQPSLEMP